MERAQKWPSWLIMLGWSSDSFVAMHLGNSTQWESAGLLQQPCGLCWQCEMKALLSDRETGRDHMQSSGDCSLGLPSMDLDLSTKGGPGGVLWASGKMEAGTGFGFSTQLCQSRSFLNNNSPITFQQSCTFVGCQIRCLSDTLLSVSRTTEFSIYLIPEERFIFTFLKWWSRTPVRPGLRKCFSASISQKGTKGSIVGPPEMDMKMRQRNSILEDKVLAVATQAAGNSTGLASHGAAQGLRYSQARGGSIKHRAVLWDSSPSHSFSAKLNDQLLIWFFSHTHTPLREKPWRMIDMTGVTLISSK